VLAGKQVGGQRPHPRPVLGRGADAGRRVGHGHATTAAAAVLQGVLDHPKGELGQVEHLPSLGGDHRRVGQGGAAAGAHRRAVAHPLGRVRHLGQRRPGMPRLTAGRAVGALPGATAAPVWHSPRWRAVGASCVGSGPAVDAARRPARPTRQPVRSGRPDGPAAPRSPRPAPRWPGSARPAGRAAQPAPRVTHAHARPQPRQDRQGGSCGHRTPEAMPTAAHSGDQARSFKPPRRSQRRNQLSSHQFSS
jgi:hypothetical protein